MCEHVCFNMYVCFCVKMFVNIYSCFKMFVRLYVTTCVCVCVNICVCVYQQVSYTSVTLAVCIHPNPVTSVTLVVCTHQSPRVARSHTVSIVSTSCSRLRWLPLQKACLLSMIAGELLVYETTSFTQTSQSLFTRICTQEVIAYTHSFAMPITLASIVLAVDYLCFCQTAYRYLWWRC